jgi:phosphoribosylformylglycinamidine cyclo-ligase
MNERAQIQDVNIELGDDISKMLYEASKLTHENRPGFLTELHQSFTGFRAIPISVLKDAQDLYINLGFDGVGTKVEIAERMDDHSVVAYDLFAMVCDDAVVRGAEPVAIGSILDVRQLGDPEDPESLEYTKKAIQQLGQGYVDAAKAAGVVVVNGEVAELGDRVGGHGEFNYNWGAAILWIAHKNRVLTGHQVQPGHSLVGLTEHGFRSNGITDVRRTMLEHYGPEWHNVVVPALGEVSLGKLVQRPSTIYSKFVSSLTGGYNIDNEPKAAISAVSHITGGGQPSKLGRMLEPSGLGVIIDKPIDPPAIMLEVQKLSKFSDEKAYGKWHMGPGMVIATPDPETVLNEAAEQGIDAQEIGHITNKPGIKIKNRGVLQSEEWLTF